LTSTHRLHLVSVIQLYKALGGGWSPQDSAQQMPSVAVSTGKG
jgi:outer membrane protein, multidrug efflux system